MYLRTATNSNTQSLLSNVFSSQDLYNTLSQQLVSGSKIQKPSDDATAAISILNTNKQLAQMDGYKTNIKTAENELTVLDSTLSQAVDKVQRAYDLAVSGASETTSDSSMAAMKAELDEIINSVVDLGNTQFNGTYIFAGTNTTTTPFVQSDDGSISYVGTQNGSYQRSVEIADGVTEVINADGKSLFGTYDAATETGTGLIGKLKELSNAMGETPPDYDTIRSGIDNMLEGVDDVSTVRTKFGAVSNRMDMTLDSITTNSTQLKSYKSSLQDVDYAEAVTNLTMAQYSLQATLSVVAQTSQISLLNYL